MVNSDERCLLGCGNIELFFFYHHPASLSKAMGLNHHVRGSQMSQSDSVDEDVQAFLPDQDQLHTYDDLTKVNPVTPTTVLKCLQARYRMKVFYTHAGCTLVALNPFQSIPDLYSLDVMKEYHCAPQPQEFKPHIFIVAEKAYRNVRSQLEPVDQSLVVSGESGAGKTWTSRCLMKYYATVAASSSVLKSQNTVKRIERRVLDSNSLMEPFGNACTLRNHNSSRFGKYIQLQLDRCQLLVGASVQTYLLEKTRVSCQPANERNFHIFYQVTHQASTCSNIYIFYCLTEDCFQDTVEAMDHLGINAEKQQQIFRILAGILHLGNLGFSSSVDESQPCNLDEKAKGFLHRAAELLCVSAEDLQTCLRVQTLRAGKQNMLKPCSQAQCIVRRDCLAKLIYAHIWSEFLDVYGFECFHINNLEQLCINYANEKLQQHFVAHYLKAQQEDYVSEGLEWSFIKYQDNQSCLDLIEGSPLSVFSLLNEESRLNRDSDARALKVRLEKELCGNANISWHKFSQVPHFTVAHYAGKVSYQLEGMVEKNKDPVPPELISLLQKSDNQLLQQMFSQHQTENSTKGLSKVTVVSKFKNSLESLMKILHATTPHYTRCIKPNPECKPLMFKKQEVVVQLEACGIVEAIHISAAGFPLESLESQRKRILSGCAFSIQCCWRRYQERRRRTRQQSASLIQAAVRSWLVRKKVQRWIRAARVIQSAWRRWQSLADAELDDSMDLMEERVPALGSEIRERGSVQLSTIHEPVTVRAWPMGLALASAPRITVSLTSTGFQKMLSLLNCLNLISRKGEYKAETNQCTRELASIRAEPQVSKRHFKKNFNPYIFHT
uniref:Myosin motor domain-containing protein n=1 Tax=Gouania willdenowi TaxID=441366 RepID=A0A8C5GSZ5_GOUWI